MFCAWQTLHPLLVHTFYCLHYIINNIIKSKVKTDTLHDFKFSINMKENWAWTPVQQLVQGHRNPTAVAPQSQTYIYTHSQTQLQHYRLKKSSSHTKRGWIKMKMSSTIHTFLPIFALQLSDELPLLFVNIKVDAPFWYHLKNTNLVDLHRLWVDKLSSKN